MSQRHMLRIILLALLILGALVISLSFDLRSVLDQDTLEAMTAENYLQGLLFYVAVAVALKLSFAPFLPVSAMGGYLFGPWVGMAASMTTIVLSSLIAFFAARFLGSGFIESVLQKNPESRLRMYKERLEENAFAAVLFFRIVPILPHSAVNTGFGLTRVSAWDFTLGTVVGSLPGVFLLTHIGDTLDDYTDPKLYAFGILYIALVAATFWWGRKLRNRNS